MLLSFPAPDPPDFLSRYHMIEGSDYAQQTLFVNAIDDSLISEEQRIVCYNQTIYDDQRLELDEYTGLTLGARVRSATIITVVGPMRADASILILDNDSKRLTTPLNTEYFDAFLFKSRSTNWPRKHIIHSFRRCWCS